MGERAPSVPGVVLDLGTGLGLAARQGLALTRELHRRWVRCESCLSSVQCPVCTHHIDLGHGVDEDDGEDGDGEAEEEAAGQVPDDAPQPDRQQQHQDDGDPDEGGEEQQEEDGGAGQHQRLHQPIRAQYCGGWTNQSSVLWWVDQSELSIHLQPAQQQRDQQRAGQRGREPYVGVLLVLRDSDIEMLYVVLTYCIVTCLSLSESRKQSVTALTWLAFSWSTDRASIAWKMHK